MTFFLLWAEKPFEFPILAEKSSSISVKTFFFFLEITCFWAEKPFEFLILAEKSSQFRINRVILIQKQ